MAAAFLPSAMMDATMVTGPPPPKSPKLSWATVTILTDGEDSPYERRFKIVQRGDDADALQPSIPQPRATKLCALDGNHSAMGWSRTVTINTDGRYHLFRSKKYHA
ncbi:hypothetical protein GGTG_07691 [Gaeumannomyces tritici R3-111a-1]|uniref:Uncharacterized protein n=1 Tax=Gaeumannomyces tritici (strain R3-111a-1) TaxID=644352 RepID=J3P2E4_GAET3|nr:hypothetical protein GGTG_07691 [Gaeumannomyces tritici R3-111a-1]EJT73836.1 hypothetical protein GGTG_07691 [Gaeumannomyces tritici R3-111a-1]